MMITFHVYEGHDKQWYWRAKARNGRTIADGAEGYTTRYGAFRAVRNFVGDISDGAYDWPPT